MSIRAYIHGVKVFIRQVLCHHTMMRHEVSVSDGRIVPVLVCRHCGYTNYHPIVW